DTTRLLEKEGIDIAIIPVNKEGVIDLEKLKEEINNQTVLVSVMYVNNELATIQPIKEIAEIIKDYKSENNSSYPLFHSDAVQAFQLIDCNVEELGVDLMTISAHKIYGPKGIGALYVKSLDTLSPIITGGGQEFNLRSGTQNTPSIIGFGKAVEMTLELRDKERKRLQELSSYFWKEVKSNFPKAQLNGPAVDSSVRLPHILNISFPGNKSEEMLIKLDMAGVAVSTGSACSARSIKESHVLQAINLPYNIRNSSLRFSFGRPTIKEQVEELVEILKKTI
ncbi:MAG: cysteine desulfurase family protein, partial [Candidatus Paceibacterota bacterium]